MLPFLMSAAQAFCGFYEPRRGVWGGPGGRGQPPVKPAGDSMAKRSGKAVDLAAVLLDDVLPIAPTEGKRRPERKETIPEAE